MRPINVDNKIDHSAPKNKGLQGGNIQKRCSSWQRVGREHTAHLQLVENNHSGMAVGSCCSSQREKYWKVRGHCPSLKMIRADSKDSDPLKQYIQSLAPTIPKGFLSGFWLSGPPCMNMLLHTIAVQPLPFEQVFLEERHGLIESVHTLGYGAWCQVWKLRIILESSEPENPNQSLFMEPMEQVRNGRLVPARSTGLRRVRGWAGKGAPLWMVLPSLGIGWEEQQAY